MARLSPPIETINRLHQPITEGERTLLTFLSSHLSDEYEVFFQPFLNGDNPDIVIMREHGGVFIFEVKDWNMAQYYIDEDTNWHVRTNNAQIKSPISQVNSYKDNLYNLHIDNLLSKKIKDSRYLAIVNCGIYFHHSTENSAKSFILDDFSDDRYKRYRKFISYFTIWGNDSLTENKLNGLLRYTRLSLQSYLFDDQLYRSFKRYLQPPFHQLDEGIELNYTREQQELIRSEVRPRRKIKGLAGSGKTFVLAKRAVNAHIRTNSTILILTFNLSLKNYIHDRINDVREEFFWINFYITNYHQFIKTQANNYELEINTLEPFDDINFFSPVRNKIKKFQVILIDEIQDYNTNWLTIIHNYFLEEGGEFVVFGDEKQNIYNLPLDEKKEPRTVGIPGDWNRSLNTSQRFTTDIGRLALKFQKNFFDKKYTLDELTVIENPTLDFDQRIIKYNYEAATYTVENIFNFYKNIVEINDIHPSNVGILSSKVEILRELDHLIRNEQHENTITTFESKEEYDSFVEEYGESDRLDATIEGLRRNKKNHFWMNTGTVKLSTVHSFKGWEIHSLILLIEDEIDEYDNFTTSELVYTGLTRARNNIFILNLGNNLYHNFFSENINN